MIFTLSFGMLMLFDHFSVGSQTLWSLATNLSGAHQVCGLFIKGRRRLNVRLPGFSSGASKVLLLTCIILVWDSYLLRGPQLCAGFLFKMKIWMKIDFFFVNFLNAENQIWIFYLTTMLWLLELPTLLVGCGPCSFSVWISTTLIENLYMFLISFRFE